MLIAVPALAFVVASLLLSRWEADWRRALTRQAPNPQVARLPANIPLRQACGREEFRSANVSICSSLTLVSALAGAALATASAGIGWLGLIALAGRLARRSRLLIRASYDGTLPDEPLPGPPHRRARRAGHRDRLPGREPPGGAGARVHPLRDRAGGPHRDAVDGPRAPRTRALRHDPGDRSERLPRGAAGALESGRGGRAVGRGGPAGSHRGRPPAELLRDRVHGADPRRRAAPAAPSSSRSRSAGS